MMFDIDAFNDKLSYHIIVCLDRIILLDKRNVFAYVFLCILKRNKEKSSS
jgi:hypothetical protein